MGVAANRRAPHMKVTIQAIPKIIMPNLCIWCLVLMICNRVAMEWASMPVLTQMAGHRQAVQPGMSYYEGYGSNRALLSGEDYNKYRQMYGIGATPQEQPQKSLVQTATDYLSDVFWNPKKLFGSTTD